MKPLESEEIKVTELIQFLVQVLHEKGNIPVKFWNDEYGEPITISTVKVFHDFTAGGKQIVLLQ